MAFKTALGALIAVVVLGLGAVSASAVTDPGTTGPNPGYGNSGGITGDSGPSYSLPLLADGPQTANVPTVAWIGEEVRLVACDSSIDPLADQTATFALEEWGGSPLGPPSFATGSDFFFPTNPENAGKGCVAIDVQDLSGGGLAQYKLTVTTPCLCGLLGYNVTYQQAFNVIWLTPEAPTLTETSISTQGAGVNALDYPGTPGTDALPTTFAQLSSTGITNAGKFLGDPTGNGQFNPDKWGWDSPVGGCGCTPNANNGLIDIRVKGTFPVSTLQQSQYDLTSSTYTLPDDWAELAEALADTSQSTGGPGSDPGAWDIHGGPTNADVHPGAEDEPCPTDAYGVTFDVAGFDGVDNCLGGPGQGSGAFDSLNFSRVFGDVTYGPTSGVGPYDPEFPNETLISDGKLNADDAPMPALPVELSITGNSCTTVVPGCQPGDISGVGGLYAVSKALIYSHDFNGVPTPGNLYNPYYGEFIPSTARPYSEASGVDGVIGNSGGDFPGFTPSPGLNPADDNLYTFWSGLNASTVDSDTDQCLRRTDADNTPDPGGDDPYDPNGGPVDYQSPYYPTSLTVYTDERGEAYVVYNPGTGFYLANLAQPFDPTGPINLSDGEQGCDLQNLLNQPIGTSTITSKALPPYQDAFTAIPGGSLTKTVTSLWSKTLTSYPKTSSTTGTFFVAQATDINGQPFADEEVCFSDSGEGFVQDYTGLVIYNGVTEADTTDATPLPYDQDGIGPYFCELTGSNGEAAITVLGSNGAVDVTAEFVGEEIYRDVPTTLGATGGVQTSGSTPGVLPYVPVEEVTASTTAGSAGSAGSSAGSAGSAGSTGTSTTGPLSVQKVENVCKVDSYRLEHSRKEFSVRLKLSCTAASSTSVTFQELKRNGKVERSMKRTVKAGKFVTITLGTKKFARLRISL